MLKISVIIPVYNAGVFLRKAVHSALQFDEVKEILLLEDGSTDFSLQVCRELVQESERIKLFRHPDGENRGAGASRNLGLEKATQEFIAFLDADDYYLPNRFDAEKEFFKNEKIEGVFGAVQADFISEKGKKVFEDKFNGQKLTTVNFAAEGKDVFRGLLGLTPITFGTFFHLNTLTIRRNSLLQNKLKFNPDLRVHQDSDFIFRLAFHCNLTSGIIDKPVAMRGVHDDNRITEIKKFSAKYNQNQFLFWKSLYEWSRKTAIPRDAEKIIFLQYKAFQLSLKKNPKKILSVMATVVKYPALLKSRYRYTFLKR